jgi:hypothetical protein
LLLFNWLKQRKERKERKAKTAALALGGEVA